MGKSIDEILEYLTDFSIYSPYQEAIDKVSAYIEQMQADYEARLKADLKAVLVKLQLEIKELWDNRYDVWLDNQYYIGKSDTLEEVDELIQQKINALKGEQE